jgi:hypothetical protein
MALLPFAGLAAVAVFLVMWLIRRGHRVVDLGAVSESWVAQQRAAAPETDR